MNSSVLEDYTSALTVSLDRIEALLSVPIMGGFFGKRIDLKEFSKDCIWQIEKNSNNYNIYEILYKYPAMSEVFYILFEEVQAIQKTVKKLEEKI